MKFINYINKNASIESKTVINKIPYLYCNKKYVGESACSIKKHIYECIKNLKNRKQQIRIWSDIIEKLNTNLILDI